MFLHIPSFVRQWGHLLASPPQCGNEWAGDNSISGQSVTAYRKCTYDKLLDSLPASQTIIVASGFLSVLLCARGDRAFLHRPLCARYYFWWKDRSTGPCMRLVERRFCTSYLIAYYNYCTCLCPDWWNLKLVLPQTHTGIQRLFAPIKLLLAYNFYFHPCPFSAPRWMT